MLLSTLWPGESPTARDFAWCIGCGELGTLDVLLNIALFVPFGMFGSRHTSAIRAVAWAAGASLLLSLAIEISQLLLVRGRDPSLSDIVANTLGGTVGATIVVMAPRIARAQQRTWHRLTWGWVLLCASVLAFGAWAVAVAAPREAYYVQWEPQRPRYAPFRGQLEALSLNGLTFAAGEVVSPARLPAEFFDGRIALEGMLTPGAPPDAIALIARIALASGEFLMIGQERDAFVARYRANAHRVGLRSPLFALHGVLRAQPSVATRLHVLTRPREVELQAAAGANIRVARYRVSTARLWATLLPFDHAFGRLGLVGDVLWLGLLFGPAAYGGARSRSAWRGVAPVSVLALLAIVTQPALRWWPFWAAAMTTAAVGYALGIRARLRADSGRTPRPHANDRPAS